MTDTGLFETRDETLRTEFEIESLRGTAIERFAVHETGEIEIDGIA